MEFEHVADIIVALMAVAAVIISLWGIKHTRASMLLAFYEQGDAERLKLIRSKIHAYTKADIERIIDETRQLENFFQSENLIMT